MTEQLYRQKITANRIWYEPVEPPASQKMQEDEPVTRKCKADFYALWCDNCNLHPTNCPLRALALLLLDTTERS